jgi:hypothetical protein
MNYKIYTVAIMLGNKVVQEIHNVFASNQLEAETSAWQANVAQQYRDGRHTAKAYS